MLSAKKMKAVNRQFNMRGRLLGILFFGRATFFLKMFADLKTISKFVLTVS